MVIVHGEKVVRHSTGWVVSFCPLCRSVRPHEVLSVGIAAHVYLVQAGKAQQKHLELVCDGCKSVSAVKNGGLRKSAVRSERPASGTVDPETYPWRIESLERRLALEQQLKDRRLSPAERDFLVREPIKALSYQQARCMRECGWVSVMSVTALVLAVFAMAAAILWATLAGEPKPTLPLKVWTYAMTGATVVVVGLCAWLYVSLPRLAGRRWRSAVLRSLEPLAVSPDELERTLRSLDQGRTSPARALRASDLVSHFAGALVVPVTPGKAY